jgi:hypothetical protein
MHGIVSRADLTGRQLNRGALSGRQWSEFMLKLETAGLESKLAQRVIESKGNVLAKQVVDLIANRGDLGLPMSLERLALGIMGDNIVFPHEITEERGLSYTDDKLKLLSIAMPAVEVMDELKKNGFALMPLPPEPLSLLDLLNGRPEHFYSTYTKTPAWYTEPEQTFAQDEKTGFGWMAVKKAPIVSMSTNWDEQNKVISGGLDEGRMPNAAEMAWFISIFKEVRDTWLFPTIYVRTSSAAANGNPVFMGRCDSYGIGIVNHHGVSYGGSIGVLTSVVQ